MVCRDDVLHVSTTPNEMCTISAIARPTMKWESCICEQVESAHKEIRACMAKSHMHTALLHHAMQNAPKESYNSEA